MDLNFSRLGGGVIVVKERGVAVSIYRVVMIAIAFFS